MYGNLAVWTMIILTQSLLYWFFNFNPTTQTIALVSPLAIMLFLNHTNLPSTKFSITNIKNTFKKAIQSFSLTYLAAYLMMGILFALLFIRRSGDTLLSPWQLFGPKFFILLLTTIVLAIYIYTREKNVSLQSKILLTLWYGFVWCTGVIVYAHGFGFDPFIHEATQTHIANHGLITPKQPFYIGQYMLTLLTHRITHLSIGFIDKLWVPVLATLLLPTFLIAQRSKNTTKSIMQQAIFLLALFSLPFFTFNFFTQTTPNNLALIIATLTGIFAYSLSKKPEIPQLLFTGGLIALSVAIHPFIGLPLAVCIGSYLLLLYFPQKQIFVYALYIPTLIGILPLALILNAARGLNGVSLQNPLNHLNTFFALFERPFWYWFDNAPLIWQLLYHYKGMIKPIFFFIACVGIYFIFTRISRLRATHLTISLISIFISAFLLATAFSFAQVIDYEQNVYADRLLELMVVLLIPAFILGLQEIFTRIHAKRNHAPIAIVLLAIVLIISVYFTYPTRDAVSRYTGYNVRDADIHAVQLINARNQNNAIDYIVLANQTVSAAALSEFGFAKYYKTPTEEFYYYSIPTGGTLYQSFLSLVYEGVTREHVYAAMDAAGVDKAYFIHTNYWAPAAKIRDQAIESADNWWSIDGDRAWVFEYIRNN